MSVPSSCHGLPFAWKILTSDNFWEPPLLARRPTLPVACPPLPHHPPRGIKLHSHLAPGQGLKTPPPTPLGLQGAGAHCAVLPPRLQCLHFHLWSDGDREDLQHGGGKGGENSGWLWGHVLGCEPNVAPPHPQGPPEDPGIAPRALQSLFREMRTGGQHCVTLSMVEIYNEAVRSGLRPGCLLLGHRLPSPSSQEPLNQALTFFTRDLLAPGPPQRLVVRQGPAGQGGLQVAGLTYWDVPNLETLNQVRLPRGRVAFQSPACAHTWRCGPYSKPSLVLHPPDAEPGEEQPGDRRHRHEPAQLALARPGYADAASSVPNARFRHRRYLAGRRPALRGASPHGRLEFPLRRLARLCRHAAFGRPGRIRACLEGGGRLQGAGRP